MQTITLDKIGRWIEAAPAEKWSHDGGMAVKIEGKEIAVFNFASKGEWYAISNLCPHKKQMILARGIIGDKAGEPKVACPYHKKQFSLKTGAPIDDHDCESVTVYPVKIENGWVYVGLPE